MKFRSNKKGVVDDWLPLLFFIVAVVFLYLWFGVFFINKPHVQATQNIRDVTLDRNMIIFLETPVSVVSSNYKIDFLADEDDIFADVIPRLCDILNGNYPSEQYSIVSYYAPKPGYKCVDGKILAETAAKIFEELGSKNIGIYINNNFGDILTYNEYSKKPLSAEIILPSANPKSDIKLKVTAFG